MAKPTKPTFRQQIGRFLRSLWRPRWFLGFAVLFAAWAVAFF